MEQANTDSMILRFFKDDIGGILITDETGEVLYEDEKTAFIRKEKTNWKTVCPPPVPGQRGEIWDLLLSESGRTYMGITSTYRDENGRILQIHHLVDTTLYMGLYRDMTDYSRNLQKEKERDGLTGLFNRGKFMEMKRTLFSSQDAIAVFNMDVNNLKAMNDRFGHEAGDRMIRKAAESLKRIEARNIMPFRVGGDEFIVIAIHVNREEAEKIRQKWSEGLAELNRVQDGVPCTIACGFVFAEEGYDLEEILALADRRMYEDKKAGKARDEGKTP